MSRIAAAARLTPDDVVLEVGPGFGSLTLPLLGAAGQRGGGRDRRGPGRGAARDRGRPGCPELAGRLTVVTRRRGAGARPARRRRRPRWWPTCPTTSPSRSCCTCWPRSRSLRRGLVMVQAEVADRMAAPPGSRTYGIPSAKLAWYADVRRAGSVPRSAFWPVPRVDSGLVALHRAGRSGRPDRGGASPGRRCSRSSTRRSRSGARRCGRRWRAGPGRPRRPSGVLRAAGIDPGRRGRVAGDRRVHRDRGRAARRSPGGTAS